MDDLCGPDEMGVLTTGEVRGGGGQGGSQSQCRAQTHTQTALLVPAQEGVSCEGAGHSTELTCSYVHTTHKHCHTQFADQCEP